MMKKKQLLYWIILAIVLCVWTTLCNKSNENEVETKHTSDTIYIHKVDTIVEYKISYFEKKDIGTISMPADTTLPIVQKHYQRQDVYDLWISGIEPLQVDSVKTYPKTIYRYVDNFITKETYPKRTELYVFGGIDAIGDKVIPNVGISIKTKNEWLISPKIGLYENKPYYGITVGKKINF